MCHTVETYVGRTKYTWYFFYKVNSIINTCDSLSYGVFDNYIFTRADNTLVYQSTSENVPDHAESSFSNKVYHDKTGYYFKDTLSPLNWYIISYSSNATFYSSIYDIFSMVIILSIIFFFLVLIMVIPIVAHRLHPIQELNQTMQHITKESINAHANIHTDDEIGELSNTFNIMVDNIHDHIQWRLENEKNLYKVQYNLLVAQIDSHFIYNTMSIINSLARHGKNKDVIKINTALIEILRNCLRVKSFKITDTLEQEVNILNQYLIIEKMRFDNHADLIIKIPPELMAAEIPKNILQPIVENSFRHGLYNKKTGEICGTVTLEVSKENQQLKLHIFDNGTGANPQIIEMLNSTDDFEIFSRERGKHIGLSNIHQRLKFIYKDAASIVFSSQDGFETLITIDENAQIDILNSEQ